MRRMGHRGAAGFIVRPSPLHPLLFCGAVLLSPYFLNFFPEAPLPREGLLHGPPRVLRLPHRLHQLRVHRREQVRDPPARAAPRGPPDPVEVLRRVPGELRLARRAPPRARRRRAPRCPCTPTRQRTPPRASLVRRRPTHDRKRRRRPRRTARADAGGRRRPRRIRNSRRGSRASMGAAATASHASPLFTEHHRLLDAPSRLPADVEARRTRTRTRTRTFISTVVLLLLEIIVAQLVDVYAERSAELVRGWSGRPPRSRFGARRPPICAASAPQPTSRPGTRTGSSPRGSSSPSSSPSPRRRRTAAGTRDPRRRPPFPYRPARGPTWRCFLVSIWTLFAASRGRLVAPRPRVRRVVRSASPVHPSDSGSIVSRSPKGSFVAGVLVDRHQPHRGELLLAVQHVEERPDGFRVSAAALGVDSSKTTWRTPGTVGAKFPRRQPSLAEPADVLDRARGWRRPRRGGSARSASRRRSASGRRRRATAPPSSSTASRDPRDLFHQGGVGRLRSRRRGCSWRRSWRRGIRGC